MMLLLLTIVVLGCSAITPKTLVEQQWKNYKLKYNKIYLGEIEQEYRFKIFKYNLHQINQHNKLYEMHLSTYKLGINQFSDLLHFEFLQKYTMSENLTELPSDNQNMLFYEPNNIDQLKDSCDWRNHGAVTDVKDQTSSCNSGWAFGATGAIEGQLKIKKGKLVSLSEQNLVDCVPSVGCTAGFVDMAFDYIIDNNGLDTEASYPYEGKPLGCRYNSKNVGAQLKAYRRVQQNEIALQTAVSKIGPIVVAIDATDKNFQHYTTGVYNNPSCDKTFGSQFVLAVGYGSKDGQDYWLIKNSWGKSWGQKGYALMSRNKNNQCGISNYAFFPFLMD